MRNLLILSPWFPYPADNGSRLRIYSLLDQLSKHYRIRLVAGTQADSPDGIPDALAALCQVVERVPWIWHAGGRRGILNALRAIVSPVPRSILETPNPSLSFAIQRQLELPTDAILVCELGMDAYLPQVDRSIRTVLDGAEITGMKHTYDTAKGIRARIRSGLTYQKGMRYWRRRLQRYEVVTAASSGEADALRALVEGRGPQILVVPNGVDVSAFPTRDPSLVRAGRLIYNGALTYGPNRTAVDFFVNEVMPLIVDRVPQAHLIVTGRFERDKVDDLLLNPRVELTGYLDDLRPALAAAAVCVVPLQSGGGTRLKILEAWGAGLPVVSTTIGAAGLDGAEPERHFLLADIPRAFADASVRLLATPTLGQTLAANARELAERKYAWSASAAPLIAALNADDSAIRSATTN